MVGINKAAPVAFFYGGVMLLDHERSLSFVEGLVASASTPTLHAITLYPETVIHIRRVIDRVKELENREIERRAAAKKGGLAGGPIGGASTSEKKRAASRANLKVARAKKGGLSPE